MSKKIKYSDEPKDGLELPEAGYEILRPEAAEKAGVPMPKRGGARSGAGRKPVGHVRMQILILPQTRKRIEAVARREGVTLSKAVDRLISSAG
jgi:hypothetical protein